MFEFLPSSAELLVSDATGGALERACGLCTEHALHIKGRIQTEVDIFIVGSV